MKKIFLMIVCVMAVCFASCTKELNFEEEQRKDTEWMESYWGKDYSLLVGTWVSENTMGNISPLYVEINANHTYKSNGLVTSVGHQMSSGDWVLFSNDVFRNVIEFHSDYRERMHISWADNSHKRICVKYAEKNTELEGVHTVYWAKM